MKSPKTFFQMCLNFICDNLHCVESLVGFPDSIGRKILFKAFDLDPKSDRPLFLSSSGDLGIDNIRNSLQVFFEAYGDCSILDSFSLQRDPFFLNETVDDCWWLYQHVSHLDLSYCGLGDSHDILPQLLGSTYRLKTLILKENALTDEGIRKLTLRGRMLKERNLSLETLNLSDNTGITEKSLQFLSCLTKLTILDVSNTNISGKVLSRLKLPSKWRELPHDYESSTGCECIRNSLTVVSSGWGAQAVEIWRKQHVQASRQKAVKYQCSRARLGTAALGDNWNLPSFYSQTGEKFIAEKDTDTSCYPKVLKRNVRTIFVARNLFHCPHSSVLEVEPYAIGKEREKLPLIQHVSNSTMSGDDVLKYLHSEGTVSENNQSGKEKTQKLCLAQSVAHGNFHNVSGVSSKFLPNLNYLDIQRAKNENLKRVHRDSEPEGTSCDNSQLLNTKTQPENSIVSEYQRSSSKFPSHTKRSKRSLLEVLDEYM